MNALATLKEHQYELEVLEALLAQKRWRRGRRGRWYDRRALILTTHFPKDDIEITRRAMRGVVEALLDDDTHISKCLNDDSNGWCLSIVQFTDRCFSVVLAGWKRN